MEKQAIKISGRIACFDTAKACLIALVILGHILIVLNPGYDKLPYTVVQAFIYSFHMPAFFLIHGVLFNIEKWKKAAAVEFLIKRVYSMMIPYLFFEIVGIIWKAIFASQSLLTGLYNMLTVRCNVGADWFLPALFLGSLLFFIYVKHPGRVYGILSTLVCFVLPMFMSGHQITIVIGRGMLAYGFIMIGNAGKKGFQSEKLPKVLWLAASLTVTGIAAMIGLKFGGNDFYTCTVNNPILLVIGGISGTIMTLGISRILHCKMLTYIGKHTLTIMGTHQLVIYGMTARFSSLYGGSIIKGFALLMVIIIFEIPLVWLIDRYLPFFVGGKLRK